MRLYKYGSGVALWVPGGLEADIKDVRGRFSQWGRVESGEGRGARRGRLGLDAGL